MTCRGAPTAGGSPRRGPRAWPTSGTGTQAGSASPSPATQVSLWGLDWSPVGHRLATGGDDGTARVSEITRDGARPLLTFSAQETSRGGGLIGVSFSPDGRRLMAGDLGVTSVTVWDADPFGGSEWASAVGSVGVMPDGRGLLVGALRGALNVIDAETGATSPRSEGPERHRGRGGDGGGRPRRGPRERGRCGVPRSGSWTSRPAPPCSGFRGANAIWMWDMAWSPDGAHLAIAFLTADPARSLLVVDETGRRVARLPELAGHSTRSVSFSADGRRLATTRWGIDTVDPTQMPVRIWDLETQTVARRIDATAELTEFAPTGGLIASSRPVDGIAEIWDAGTGVRIATLTATAHIAALAFDASGSRLATAHTDGTVRLWDPRTGSQDLVLRRRRPGGRACVVHPRRVQARHPGRERLGEGLGPGPRGPDRSGPR